MGVPVRIVAYGTEREARRAADAAFARAATLDRKMSDYNPESELRRATRRAGRWVPISADLVAVLARSVEVARRSDGAFDPTVGPVVLLWRDARRLGRLPDSAALESARTLVSWRMLHLDTTRSRIRLQRAGMRLDLGGIAKGYVVQQMLIELRRHGVRRALVEAGGDIAVGDAPPGRHGWHVATPGASAAVAARATRLVNRFVSTSGPTEQFVVIAGVRYSHVVDPRTGQALRSANLATVIADDGALADALSTALTVLEPAGRAKLLRHYPGVVASVQRPSRPTDHVHE